MIQALDHARLLVCHALDRLGAHVPRPRNIDGHNLLEEAVGDYLVLRGTNACGVDQAIQPPWYGRDEALAVGAPCDIAFSGVVNIGEIGESLGRRGRQIRDVDVGPVGGEGLDNGEADSGRTAL